MFNEINSSLYIPMGQSSLNFNVPQGFQSNMGTLGNPFAFSFDYNFLSQLNQFLGNNQFQNTFNSQFQPIFEGNNQLFNNQFQAVSSVSSLNDFSDYPSNDFYSQNLSSEMLQYTDDLKADTFKKFKSEKVAAFKPKIEKPKVSPHKAEKTDVKSESENAVISKTKIEKPEVSNLKESSSGKSLANAAKKYGQGGDGHHCYAGVKKALRAIDVNLSGESAYMAAGQLARSEKFEEVKVDKSDLPNLPAGAVVVWNKNEKHIHGHISVADGAGNEYSDKERKQLTNYGSAFRVFMPKDKDFVA